MKNYRSSLYKYKMVKMKNYRSSLYKYKMVPSIENENFNETEANNDIASAL